MNGSMTTLLKIPSYFKQTLLGGSGTVMVPLTSKLVCVYQKGNSGPDSKWVFGFNSVSPAPFALITTFLHKLLIPMTQPGRHHNLSGLPILFL